MEKRKIVGFIAAAALVACCFVFLTVAGKVRDTINEYSSTYTYFDTERNYVSDLELSFNLETRATYKEEIKIREDINSKLYIKSNDLTDDITLKVKNKKSKLICERTLKKTEAKQYLSDDVYTDGTYILEMTLPQGCTGALEITVNEE